MGTGGAPSPGISCFLGVMTPGCREWRMQRCAWEHSAWTEEGWSLHFSSLSSIQHHHSWNIKRSDGWGDSHFCPLHTLHLSSATIQSSKIKRMDGRRSIILTTGQKAGWRSIFSGLLPHVTLFCLWLPFLHLSMGLCSVYSYPFSSYPLAIEVFISLWHIKSYCLRFRSVRATFERRLCWWLADLSL